MKLVDIGVNLTSGRFHDNWREVVQSANQAGVESLIITGTSLTETAQAIEQTKAGDGLYATAGVHPHHANECDDHFIDQLAELAQQPKVVAIGECGLDFNRNYSTPEQQLRVFEQQLELAVEVKKPVFLHERDAFEQQIALLKKYIDRIPGGVAHCFTGDLAQMQHYLALGLHIGVTGWVCDERRGQALQQAVSQLPLDRLLLETDAPWLLPRTLRPRPKSSVNLPSYLPHIVEQLAQYMAVDISQIVDHSYHNAHQLFALGESS